MASIISVLPVILLLNSVGATTQGPTATYPSNDTSSLLPTLLSSGSRLVGTPLTHPSPSWTASGGALLGPAPRGKAPPGTVNFGTTSCTTASSDIAPPTRKVQASLTTKPSDVFGGGSELETGLFGALLGESRSPATALPTNLPGNNVVSLDGGPGSQLNPTGLESLLTETQAPAITSPTNAGRRDAVSLDRSSEIFGSGSELDPTGLSSLLSEGHPPNTEIPSSAFTRKASILTSPTGIFGFGSELGPTGLSTLLGESYPPVAATALNVSPRDAQPPPTFAGIFVPGSQFGPDQVSSLLDSPSPPATEIPSALLHRVTSPPHGFPGILEPFSNAQLFADDRNNQQLDCTSTTTRTSTSTETITTTIDRPNSVPDTSPIATWFGLSGIHSISYIGFIPVEIDPTSTSIGCTNIPLLTQAPLTTKTVYTTVTTCPLSARNAPPPSSTNYAALSTCLASDACQPFLAHTRTCFEALAPWSDPYNETQSAVFQVCLCQTTPSEPFNEDSPFWISYAESAACLSRAGVDTRSLANESGSIVDLCRSQNPNTYLFIMSLQDWLAQLRQGTTLSFEPLEGVITEFVPSPEWTTAPPLANLAYGASAPDGGSLAGVTPSLTTRITTRVVDAAGLVTRTAAVTELATWVPTVDAVAAASYDASVAVSEAVSSNQVALASVLATGAQSGIACASKGLCVTASGATSKVPRTCWLAVGLAVIVAWLLMA